jgi:hypothetical protein
MTLYQSGEHIKRLERALEEAIATHERLLWQAASYPKAQQAAVDLAESLPEPWEPDLP